MLCHTVYMGITGAVWKCYYKPNVCLLPTIYTRARFVATYLGHTLTELTSIEHSGRE